MKLTIRQELRASHVKRWHIVETLRPQTVAEHSFNVAMLVKRMAEIQGVDPTPYVMYALEHDLDEVVYGDIPTPSKQYFTNPNIEMNDTPDGVRQLVKFADILEAIIFLAAYGVGKHAEQVRVGLIGSCASQFQLIRGGDRELFEFFEDACRWETHLDLGEGVLPCQG